ncbi:hypothetical protein L596_009798 [Steinernema carpocapsae]|uniref:Uncharacterized protein n=1 Tax=Steinernema carpocapsae TaxID=34508 RepID=A0A4U5PGW8_STECR|nr:hypothetical protein L596_009798 [Steinernema carpocapsae]
MYGFANILYCEQVYNFTLPTWITKNNVYAKAKAIGYPGWDYLFGGTAYGNPENVELVKLYSGLQITQMIENMKKRINGTSKVLYHAYSAVSGLYFYG